MKQKKKKTLYVEGMALAHERMSGIGHLALNMVVALSRDSTFTSTYNLKLVVPFNKAAVLRANLAAAGVDVPIQRIWLPPRGIELLARLRLLPPMDLWLGKGDYLFPNYKNWPLLHSRSYTYIHDASFIRHPEFTQPENGAYLRKYVPLWIRRADTVLTISDFSKRELVELYNVPEAKIKRVYAGVDMQPATGDAVARVRSTYGIGSGDYLIAVGNIEPRKNLIRLLDAYNLAPDAFKKQYGLVIVGADSWLREDVDAKITELRAAGCNVTLPTTYVPDGDIAALITGAKALVHPALYEGFGIPPVEAMACGVPVAISNVEPMPEIAAGSAVMFDPYDTGSIKDAIVNIVKDEAVRADLVRKGLARSKQLTWAQAAKDLTQVLMGDAHV